MFTITLLALSQGFDESFQCLAGVRAGLSTRWNSYGSLVSVGAGLPTQRNDWDRFRLLFVIQNIFFELHSLGWGHCSEEGLHPSYLHLSRLLVGRLRTVSSVVSFLSTPITRLSYVYSVPPAWHVSRSCGAWSTGRCVGRWWACVCALA